MKRTITILFFALITLSLSAQKFQFEGYGKTQMNTLEECKKAEPKALECSNYLLTHPDDGEDPNGLFTGAFLIKWMGATPDYSFSLTDDFTKYAKKDLYLSSVYMATLVKTALDKPESIKDEKGFKLTAFKLFADYCADEKYKVKKNADIKKLIEANKKGKLEELISPK